MKPKRTTSIDSTIETLKQEHETIIRKSTEITLIDISLINELKLENDILMHNRISYSKTKLLELADNIAKLKNDGAGILGTGILNPIMLRRKDGKLERIHGDNRIKALQLNGEKQVPAIIVDNVSDELARFMRSSENLNREDLNAYDETLSILEHIQLACDFKDVDSVKSFILKVKNFQAGKSSLNDTEKELHKNVSSVFERVGRFDIITFVDRLSVLNLHPLIKQALVDEIINYSQAKVIKSKLKSESEIKKIIEVLKNKKLSINELKLYIQNLQESSHTESSNVKSPLENIVNLSKSINKRDYSKLSKEQKNYVDKKFNEIEIIFKEISSIITNK